MNEVPDPYDDVATGDLVNILLCTRDEDDEDSVYWNVVWTLRWRANSEVFDAARSLCESACSLEQRIGCDILAQLGGSERPFASKSFPPVASVLSKTTDLDTRISAIFALGWLGDLRGIDLVLPYLDHPNPDIRDSVTHAFTALHEDPRSIDALITLTEDSSVQVRDWATFGLGSLTDADTPAIRQALLSRLADPDATVRGEALVGLAIRQDPRVIEPLCEALEEANRAQQSHDFAEEALRELKDIDRYPQLATWRTMN